RTPYHAHADATPSPPQQPQPSLVLLPPTTIRRHPVLPPPSSDRKIRPTQLTRNLPIREPLTHQHHHRIRVRRHLPHSGSHRQIRQILRHPHIQLLGMLRDLPERALRERDLELHHPSHHATTPERRPWARAGDTCGELESSPERESLDSLPVTC